MFGREAPTYKQGTQEPQAWLIAQDSINADLSSQSLRFNTLLPTSTLDAWINEQEALLAKNHWCPKMGCVCRAPDP
jgi:hypothetical protein